MRFDSSPWKSSNPRRLANEHEEVEIAASVGERRLYSWRIWATSGMGQWSYRDTSAMRSKSFMICWTVKAGA
jgi:hypothetical protein